MGVRAKVKTFVDSHLRTFSITNVTAIAATLVDFLTMLSLVEQFGFYHVTATACGAFAGAVTNFTLNRYWAFGHIEHGRMDHQFGKYALVSAASLGLNTLGVYLLTDLGGLMYVKSRAITALAVGWFWNYPLHKYFVFKEA